ncbi:BON domain-containing protein [Burkholderia sp. AU45251]|uniref:BON domain-containing protein n=1 Tax=Burkholderia sp. AU45251 TaxID=3059204 RepID=UPI0026560AFB|nr:BON domain-containing protein [Burkholderia sp. AU45251]MDN7516355.1 BON domain-containing protein [Burkholderia sp. AU45251]
MSVRRIPVRRTIAALAGMFVMAAAAAQTPADDAGASIAAPVSPPDAATAGKATKAAKAADRQLMKRVARVLSRVAGLDSSRMLVRARDGAVTLSGTVRDNVQVSLAVAAAQAVPGVRVVYNRLRLSTQRG